MSLFGGFFGSNQTGDTMDPIDPGMQALEAFKNIGGTEENALSMAVAYTDTRAEKELHRSNMDEVKDLWLLAAVRNLLEDEIFCKESGQTSCLRITSKDKQIEQMIQQVTSSCDVEQMIKDIFPDILKTGEYFLRISGDTSTGVEDDVDQSNIFAFYRTGYVDCFAKTKRSVEGYQTEVEFHQPNEYAHFALSAHRKRVNIDGNDNKKDLPAQLRVGSSIYDGLIPKLKELHLAEALVPATNIANLQAGTIVGVSVPNGTKPEVAHNVTRRYEKILNNSKTGVNNNTQELSISRILSVAGRTRVIPLFGDKGTLEAQDIKRNGDTSQLIEGINDSRKALLSALGIPWELLLPEDLSGGTAVLKRHSRYVRLLVALQDMIIKGVRQILYASLGRQGIPFREDDIIVSFYKQYADISLLDQAELSSAVLSIFDDTHQFISALLQEDETLVPEEEYRKWMHDNLQLLLGRRWDASKPPVTKDPPTKDQASPAPSEMLELLSSLDSEEGTDH